LLSVPYYIQTSSAPFPCSPCHLSLLECRSLCIVVRALDICVRPPFSAFCTHITLRRRSRRFRRFKRWVWSPCGTHAALTRPTGRQRSPPCGPHFFFAMVGPIVGNVVAFLWRGAGSAWLTCVPCYCASGFYPQPSRWPSGHVPAHTSER
jgi:hypothetical protein